MVWSQLWQVTALITVVRLLVRFGCRHRPHLAHVLWLVVFVKCLTPPLVSSATGVFSWAQFRGRTVVTRGDSPAPHLETPRLSEVPLSDAFEVPVVESTAAAVAPGPRGLSPTVVVGGVWLLGALMLGGLALFEWLRCCRTLKRTAVEGGEPLEAALEAVAQRLGLRRRVRLVVVSARLGPAVFGFLRPTVVVPEAVLRGKTREQIEPMLAHELVHLRRGDALYGLLQFAAQVVWWFHPLVWWANRQSCRACERCCDEEVVAGLGCPPKTYARCLLEVLDSKHALRPIFAFPGVRPVLVTSQRLQAIMRHSHAFHRRTPRWCWAVMIATAAVALPGAALVAVSPSVAGADKVPAALAVQQDDKDEAEQPEHPQLRFLASQHQPPATEQEPLAGNYWLPTGEPVDDQQRLFQLRRIGGWRENNRRPGSTFLYVFISHPEFMRYPVGTLDVVNADGSLIDEALLGIGWVRARAPLGERVAPRWRWPGWQFYQLWVPPEVALPEKGRIRLHYTTGRGESVARFTVREVRVGEDLVKGLLLSQIGDDQEGHAEIAITVDPALDGRFQYQLQMRDLEGRRLRVDGYTKERDGVYRFSFRKRLSALGEFELLRHEKRSVEYRDVHFRPRGSAASGPTGETLREAGGALSSGPTERGRPVGASAAPAVQGALGGQSAAGDTAAAQRELTVVDLMEAASDAEKTAIAMLRSFGAKMKLSEGGRVISLTAGGTDQAILSDEDLVYFDQFGLLFLLSLNGKKITDSGMVHLKGLTHLVVLAFNHGQFTDAGMANLKDMTKLQRLSIWDTKITDAGLVHLKGMTELQDLTLTHNAITGEGLVHLKGLAKLNRLVLKTRAMTDAGMERVKGLRGEVSLGLRDSKITDVGLEHLKGLANVVDLDVSNTPITDPALKHLAGLSNLKWLYLNGTQVTGAGLEHLRGHGSLVSLGLSETRIGDAALKQLAALPAIKGLDLEMTPITNAGLEHLRGLKHLKRVSLNGTNVTPAGVKRLKEALPECEVSFQSEDAARGR